MNTITPASLAAGRSTLPAPQNHQLYRWRLSAPEKKFCLQVVARTHAEAEKVFRRFYPGIAVVANGRFVI